jgi:large subunit ribosomal protein L28
MAMKCDSCLKGVMFGHNVSHAKNRTQKIFKPNLHVARVVVNGQRRKLKLCTKCLRMFKRVAAAEAAVSTTETPQAV